MISRPFDHMGFENTYWNSYLKKESIPGNDTSNQSIYRKPCDKYLESFVSSFDTMQATSQQPFDEYNDECCKELQSFLTLESSRNLRIHSFSVHISNRIVPPLLNITVSNQKEYKKKITTLLIALTDSYASTDSNQNKSFQIYCKRSYSADKKKHQKLIKLQKKSMWFRSFAINLAICLETIIHKLPFIFNEKICFMTDCNLSPNVYETKMFCSNENLMSDTSFDKHQNQIIFNSRALMTYKIFPSLDSFNSIPSGAVFYYLLNPQSQNPFFYPLLIIAIYNTVLIINVNSNFFSVKHLSSMFSCEIISELNLQCTSIWFCKKKPWFSDCKPKNFSNFYLENILIDIVKKN